MMLPPPAWRMRGIASWVDMSNHVKLVTDERVPATRIRCPTLVEGSTYDVDENIESPKSSSTRLKTSSNTAGSRPSPSTVTTDVPSSLERALVAARDPASRSHTTTRTAERARSSTLA